MEAPEHLASPAFSLDRDQLLEVAARHRDEYRGASPFPHAVIDGLFPEEVLDAVVAEFLPPSHDGWFRFQSDLETKLASTGTNLLGPTARRLLAELNSADFIDFLSELTGIAGLVPDPHLVGGGLHQIEPGGFLKVHADFNRHPVTGLERRLNVLVYLNRGWEESWAGSLELWEAEAPSYAVRIQPLFNRLVVFTTSSRSFHGHPEPLACPPGTSRRSLALYYYSAVQDGSRAAHNTIFQQSMPEPAAGTERWRGAGRRVAAELTPPAAWKAAARLRRKFRRQ